jgi:hypothetical protein
VTNNTERPRLNHRLEGRSPGFKRSLEGGSSPAPSIKRMTAGCNGNERPYLLEISPLKDVTELTALISRKSKKNRLISRNKVSGFRKKIKSPVFVGIAAVISVSHPPLHVHDENRDFTKGWPQKKPFATLRQRTCFYVTI